MSKLDITDRLEFLAKQFDVFEHETDEDILAKCDAMVEDGWEESEHLFFTADGVGEQVLGILSKKKNKNGFTLKKISVPYNIFTDMIGADPTPNKICLQWMLNTYCKYLKDGEDGMGNAVRFAFEDLPQANEYLTLFEANKRKKRFKKMATFSLKTVKDITNINDYASLSQLYDAVDPFIERDPSNIERQMDKFVKMGEAEIPFRDRNYTIFIPKSTDANVIFNNFASWCTAKTGNSQFEYYTSKKKPNGKQSNIYIVIDNGFFKGENENIYQLHFESSTHNFGQIMNRSNSSNFDFYNEVIVNSDGVRNYFGDELTKSANDFKGLHNKNHYIDALLKFGFSNILFDMLDEKTPIIRIDKETNKKNRKVTRICDMSRFRDLETLVIMEASLNELHPSIGSLKKLGMLSFFGNNIKVLPSEIGNLSKLIFLNLVGNPITVIPDEIKQLDKSNGGMLHRIAVDKKYISEANYQKLRELLPSALFH